MLPPNQQNFVNEMQTHLKDVSTKRLNKTVVEKMGAKHQIHDQNHVKELTELAIVGVARELAHQPQKTVEQKFESILNLYERQTNLSHRTSTSVVLQQYSTPAPIGYLMGVYCGVDTHDFDKSKLALELSAGNGMLTIAANPNVFVVNEIDSTRNANLKTQGFERVLQFDGSDNSFWGNYLKVNQLKFDAVITNPPFGRMNQSENWDGFAIKDLDHQMTLVALDALRNDGRAAIIVGGHTEWNDLGMVQNGKNRIFLNYLYHHYEVDAVVNIDGQLYSRMGTQFNIRLILIRGRKAKPEGVTPLKNSQDNTIASYQALFEKIIGLSGQPSKEHKMKLLKLQAQAANLIALAELRREAELGMPYQAASNSCVVLNTETPDSMASETQQALQALRKYTGNDVDGFVQKRLKYKSSTELCKALAAEQIDAVALAIFNIEAKKQGIVVGDQTGIGKGRVAAAMIRYSIENGIMPVFITEKPNLFSDIYRDLVDVGGGHYKPYIVNARENKSNIKDKDGNIVYQAEDAAKQKSVLNSLKIPSQYQYLVLTYSQISTGVFNKTTGELLALSPKGKLVKKYAQNSVVVMDESHNASGLSNTGKVLMDILEGAKGVTFLSATFAKRPDNMPIYALKTCISEAALNPETLAEAIKKGGVALQEIVASQLVGQGQMIRRQRSMEAVETNYIVLDETARNFGVEDKQAEHRAVADTITDIMRDIINFEEAYISPILKASNKEMADQNLQLDKAAGQKKAGFTSTPYFSKLFQVVNQMLFSIKAEAVADRAIQRLKEGKKPVIAFSSTMGSFVQNLLANKSEDSDDDDDDETEEENTTLQENVTIKADFSAVLIKGLEGTLRYVKTDFKGNKTRQVFDRENLPKNAQAEYEKIEQKINASVTGICVSPIDLIKQKIEDAGYTVAEVTGRQYEVELFYGNDSTKATRGGGGGKAKDLNGLGRIDKPSGNRTQFFGRIKRRDKEDTFIAFNRFNNNEVDVLMINQSGSTGSSAHATPTKKVSAKQVKQRVMLVLQAELNINTEVQKRGRINRTGQILPPVYDYLISAIPAEKRLMMMLQRKLKSLDANTSSDQKNSEALLKFDDFLNKYGDDVVYEFLTERPELNLLLGEIINEGGDRPEDLAYKTSGRVAILTTQQQEDFYNTILKDYEEYVRSLIEQDEYNLEVESQDLKAKTLDKQLLVGGKGGTSPFGDNTYLEKMEVNILRKPYKTVELQNMITQNLEGKTKYDAYIDLLDETADLFKKREKLALAVLNEKYERMIDAIQESPQYKELAENESAQDVYLRARRNDILLAREKEKKQKDAERLKIQNDLQNAVQKFEIGASYDYKQDASTESNILAVFLKWKIDRKRKNPFTPSKVYLEFALCSSSKKTTIPLSKNTELARFTKNWHQHNENDTSDRWEKTRQSFDKGRGVRYALTGNLLQAFGADLGRMKLISFTTHDDKMRKGILLADGFEPRTLDKNGNKVEIDVTVPIFKALPVIQSMIYSYNKIITTNVELSFQIQNGKYRVMLPASKQKGGNIYTDPAILQHVEDGNFNKVSNSMVGIVNADNIARFCEILQEKHNVSALLKPAQLKEIDFEENKFNDEVNIVVDVPITPNGASEAEQRAKKLKLLKLKAQALILIASARLRKN